MRIYLWTAVILGLCRALAFAHDLATRRYPFQPKPDMAVDDVFGVWALFLLLGGRG